MPPVPDFNFAKGNSKRDPRTSSGPASNASAGAPGAASSGGGAESSHSAPRRSILEKYPERDLSHLTGDQPSTTPQATSQEASQPAPQAAAPPASASAAGASTEGASTAAPDDGGDENRSPEHADGGGDQDDAPAPSSGSSGGSSGKGPLIAMLAIVALLVIVAFLWHVNPYPPLRDAIAGLFRSEEPQPAEPAPPASPEDEAPPPAMRSWDYFVQVSSWKELGKADLDAERFRAQGFDVVVESEFIPAKGGTWYRVRLGPYETGDVARAQIAENANLLPAGVYVDSVRLSEDTPVSAPPPPDNRTGKRTATTPAAVTPDAASRLPGRDFEVIDEPMTGWAVKVSSLKDAHLARQEARKLLQQGYPSFITRKTIGGTNWYRVLVGPFNDKADANRYQQLLNVTYGNDAYTIDLSAE